MAESGRSCSSVCKTGITTGWGAFVSATFEYDTPKIVHIKNKKVGILNRLVQLGILAYVIVWGIVLQKGYQQTGRVAGVVTTKVKGAFVYNGTEDFTQHCDNPLALTRAPWDIADLIIPPEEPNSFFVMTNTWITCNQSYNICPESPSVDNSKCNLTDSTHPNCVKGEVLKGGNGPATGKCVNDSDGIGRCEVEAWCPTENENKNVTHTGPKIDVSQFTVLIKNSIEFPTLLRGERKRNILEDTDKEFLRNCTHNNSNPDQLYCPIFSLQQIVDMIPKDEYGKKTDFDELATLGGVVGLEIVWDCNLDWGLASCDPKYSARRLDNPNVTLSPGYNFRFAKYYNGPDGVEKRKVYKAYGILFKMEVSGQGGRFDLVTLVLKLGSVLALLGIAAVISDIVVLYVLGKRTYYRKKKYLNVNDPIVDDYQIIDDEEKDEAQSHYDSLNKQ